MIPNETLDLRGIPCPANAARAVMQLTMMTTGETLLVYVDDGEPLENVSRSIEVAGHELLKREQESSGWKVWVKAG